MGSNPGSKSRDTGLMPPWASSRSVTPDLLRSQPDFPRNWMLGFLPPSEEETAAGLAGGALSDAGGASSLGGAAAGDAAAMASASASRLKRVA